MDPASYERPDSVAAALLLLVAAGIGMVAIGLMAGALLRRQLGHPTKEEAYECGEPAVGTSWVSFDSRYYVYALVFLVFDAEIALLFPWAVVFRELGLAGFVAAVSFIGILVVGFAYLWRFGFLDWKADADTALED